MYHWITLKSQLVYMCNLELQPWAWQKNPVEIAAKITSKTAWVNGPSGKCMTLSLLTFLQLCSFRICWTSVHLCMQRNHRRTSIVLLAHLQGYVTSGSCSCYFSVLSVFSLMSLPLRNQTPLVSSAKSVFMVGYNDCIISFFDYLSEMLVFFNCTVLGCPPVNFGMYM